MIRLSESASVKIKEMMVADEENPYLRVGVTHGGCSGFNYGMGLEQEKKSTDQELEQFGIPILIDAESAGLLKGTEIDYKESMMGGGFTINNPNAEAVCGCGSSFRTKEKEGVPSDC